MSTASLTPTTARTSHRDVRTVRRMAAAVVLPIPALLIATQPLYRPGYEQIETSAVLDAIAGRPGAQQIFVWTGALALLTLVPAFLAAARLARRRRPALAMWAAGVNTLAYLGAGLGLVSLDMMNEIAARPGQDRAALTGYLDAVGHHGVFNLGIGLFVIGHIVGAMLLGAALWGTVPRFASTLLILSQPLHFVAFVILQNRILDALAWGLTAIALATCAVVTLRTPNDEWDLPPATP